MAIRLTRRGRAVVAVCVVGFVLAWLSGGRSLNAVVGSGLVALGAAYLQVRRLELPAVDRRLPPDDFAGATHTVRLDFRASDRTTRDLDVPFVADVRDTLGRGLVGSGDSVRAAVGSDAVAYDVTYESRGQHTIGPVTLTAVDVFGLLERKLLVRGTQSVIVFPERRAVPAWFRRTLYREEAMGPSQQRDEFERLRKYTRGDALRDVHWPATAKRDELIVKEFAAEAEQQRVHVSGGARGDAADDLAEATTSIALALLDDGVPVTVSLPNGTIDVRPEFDERRRLLRLLAFTSRGAAPDPDADVVVDADSTGTTVHYDGGRVRFDDLVSETAAGARRYATDPSAGRSGGTAATDGGRLTVKGGRLTEGRSIDDPYSDGDPP